MPKTDAIPEMQRERNFSPVRNTRPKKLTTKQIQQFNRNGYISPLDVFGAEEVEANRGYFDGIMKVAKGAGLDSYSINGWHATCRGIYDLAMDSRILDYVGDLLGENLICKNTHYFSKEPHEIKQITWHQDASAWQLTPSKIVTVWLAIDDADEENGAMQIIPRSHLHGQIPFEHASEEENSIVDLSVQHPQKYGGSPVVCAMKAGQISIHTELLLHKSSENASSRRRCGLTIRYLPPDLRADDETQIPGIVCRGRDSEGYWRHIPRPEGDQIPAKHLHT